MFSTFRTMTAMNQHSAAVYAAVNLETAVLSADPRRLLLMLFDGALVALATASYHMTHSTGPTSVAKKGESISKAIDIIGNGLKVSLDLEFDNELPKQLAALYDYMCNRLLHANLKNDKAALEEVRHLLDDLKGAWEEIADDPAVFSANRMAA
ncbi:MAG: flagellar export chaperone FliS [Rhodocyclaceae bacterium]|nr:flagellar export chaperone FliS [Rhodocyclaceae bacterium]